MISELPLPKYHQIYLVLREQLAEGRFLGGVPGELQLMKEFGVARVTVRKALQRLVADGLIERAPGRGTVPVAPAAGPRAAPKGHGAPLNGLLENIVDMGLRTSVKVLRCEVLPASGEVARQLDVAPGTPVQKALRVRSTRQGPLSHITTHVPQSIAKGFGRRELARQPILMLLEASGVVIASKHLGTAGRCRGGAAAAGRRRLGAARGAAAGLRCRRPAGAMAAGSVPARPLPVPDAAVARRRHRRQAVGQRRTFRAIPLNP
jgi:GntR family transcriptional regulator